jgi:tetratricopeptide (TPR) repeat protein
MPMPVSSPEFSKRPLLQLTLIVALTAATFLPTLNNGFIWDDDYHVTENAAVKDPAGLGRIWFTHEMSQYYPLAITSFWLEHKMWGLQPAGYHAVNVLLHTVNAILFWLILLKLAPRIAFICAILFAVHPIQVETVAWISERKNLLGLLFYFLSFLAFLKFDDSRRKSLYALSLGFFLCALLSKPVTASLGAMLLFYGWWKGHMTRQYAVKILPFLGLGMVAGLHAISLEAIKVGAQGEAWNLAFVERCLLAGRIVWFYLVKTWLPVGDFLFFYPRWDIQASNPFWWTYLITAVAIWAVLFRLRPRIGNTGVILYSAYIVSIAPMAFINIYPLLYSYVFDHFSYFSVAFLFMMLCGCAVAGKDRALAALPPDKQDIIKTSLYVLTTVFVILLSFKSFGLTQNYANVNVLWENVIAKNQGSWAAYNNLGSAYIKQGRSDKAIPVLEKAVQLKSDYAQAFNNLGAAYAQAHDFSRAAMNFQKAIELSPRMPSSYCNLADLYAVQDQYDAAAALYSKAIELSPRKTMIYTKLAIVLSLQGRRQEAAAVMKIIETIDPDNARAHQNLMAQVLKGVFEKGK